jgi:outer membrane protein assembly factor BamB
MSGNQAGDPIELGGALWSAPVTDGKYIYVTSLDHHLHIIDPATGTSAELVDLGGATPSSPVVGNDGVYIGSFSSNIEFVKSNGDHEVMTTAQNWIWGTPALKDGVLYYADLSGNLYAMELSTGAQKWDGVKPDGPIVASPLLAGDLIYVVTEEGTLLAFDQDAKVAMEKTVGGKLYTTPVLSNELVIVAPYQAEFALAAYDAEGKQAWTFTPEKK